jgi:hypothetical protein
MYHINILWQGQEVEGLLEEVDPQPGRQPEDVQVDWDTGGKKYQPCENHLNVLFQHTMAGAGGRGASGAGG